MIKEYLKLSRIEFAGFLLSIIIIGALTVHGANLRFIDILPLCALAVFFNCWGFVHNDLYDVQIDRLSSELSLRPLVRGTVSSKEAVILIGLFLLATVLCVVGFANNLKIVFPLLLVSIAFAGAYNMLSKKIPGTDILFAASTALLCTIGGLFFIPSSILSAQHFHLLLLVSFICFLDFSFFNIGSTLKDVKNDMSANARNISIAMGVRVNTDNSLIIPSRFKLILFTLKLCSLFMAVYTSTLITQKMYTLLVFAMGVFSFYLSYKATAVDVFDRREIGRIWLKQDVISKLILPLTLLPVIGIYWFVFLVSIPFLWFSIASTWLYGHGTKLNKGF